MQHWKKLGKIFEPDGSRSWMRSHASNPVADVLENDQVRIYFSGRDENNRAHISYIDIDMDRPLEVVNIAEKPLLELGQTGAFDDAGQSMGCICTIQQKKYLYYLGWNLSKNVPFRNAIGLAVKEPGSASFQRVSQGPIIDRNLVDPFSLSYPFVLYDEGEYKMWYGSHKQWGTTTSDMIHCIKYATSTDAIRWTPTGQICIDTDKEDYAFSKPCVLKEAGIFKMWYSHRGGNYRIGYAESTDGIHWDRRDLDVGLELSNDGWDSEMLCYAYIFKHQENKYMLYNGNYYGKTGIGLAVLA